MRILITNDDGFEAPGLAALATAAAKIGDVVIVAPEREWSGCGHQTTTDRPLHVTELAPDRFRINGTPADCVRLGLLHLAGDVDWVLAGVNDGGNLGVDTYMSGTCAAAREAMFLGKPAVAFSQYRLRKNPPNWERSCALAERVLLTLREQEPPRGWFWNVNFPDPGASHDEVCQIPMAHCHLDPHPLPLAFEMLEGAFHYRSNYHLRERIAASDVDSCFSGKIALTRIAHHADARG